MLWCLMPLSTIFKLYCGSLFYWWRKLEYPRENHRPVASHWQTISHIVVSSTPHLSGIRTPSISGDRHWLHVVVNPTTIQSRPQRLTLYTSNKACWFYYKADIIIIISSNVTFVVKLLFKEQSLNSYVNSLVHCIYVNFSISDIFSYFCHFVFTVVIFLYQKQKKTFYQIDKFKFCCEHWNLLTIFYGL